LLSVQRKCACGDEKSDCRGAAKDREKTIPADHHVHLRVAPLVLRGSSTVEPNCNALVVYDAGNWVWDDRDTGFFTESMRDKILTNG
jgi:hypothetical protein